MGLRQSKSLFDIARERQKQQSTSALQQQQEKLKRRFAAIGGLGSGAAIKQQQIAEQKAQEQLGGRLTEIDIAESAQEQEKQERRDEIEQARQFAREERVAGQEFGAEQAQLQRQFATGERVGGQEFAMEQMRTQLQAQRNEAQKNRDFARTERINQELFQLDVQEKAREFAAAEAQLARNFTRGQNALKMQLERDIFDWQKTAASREFDLAMQQFILDKDVTEFNQRLSKAQAVQQGLPGSALEKPGSQAQKLATGIENLEIKNIKIDPAAVPTFTMPSYG